jgi:hypothetical protein
MALAPGAKYQAKIVDWKQYTSARMQESSLQQSVRSFR